MPLPVDAALGDILLQLYRLVRGVAPERFVDEALALLKQRLPFERARWGPVPELGDGRDAERPARDERVLVVLWRDPRLRIGVRLELQREPTAPRFSRAERRLGELLAPHLAEVWASNAIMRADRRAEVRSEATRRRALVDAGGRVRAAEAGFAGLLAAEFADWHGPGLPEMLRRTVLGREPETWRGASIAVARLRDAGDGHLLGARPLSALDRLSPREHAVAAAYAAGRTHRQIAADAGISPATVRNQLQSVYAKLGVASKIELARSIGGTGSEPTGADPAREA